MGIKGTLIAFAERAKSFAGASRATLATELAAITAARDEAQARSLGANRRLDEAQKQHAAAITEHARLEEACAKKKESARPYAELGKAIIAVKAATDELTAAETAARITAAEVRDEMHKLSQREADVRRNASIADFRAAVLNYERAIQAAGLAALSDEVRKRADVAGIRLEDHSPLIDEEYLLIGGYNLNVRGHSNYEGLNPLAQAEEE